MLENASGGNQSNGSATAAALIELKEEIIRAWEDAVQKDIPAAQKHDRRILRNSLPDFLDVMGETISGKISEDQLASVSKIHARERSGLPDYTIGQVLLEYHHLRKVILAKLRTSEEDRIRIHDYIDRAIAEAGEEFHSQCLNRQSIERKNTDRANNELRSEQSIRQRFLLALSHDLRTPIAAAKMAAETLAQSKSAIEFDKFRAMVVRNIDRANKMIEYLLDANQIQSGSGLALDISNFDLYRAVSEVIEDMTAIYGPRFLVDGRSVNGFWDIRYIRRVTENLLSNAIKYGRKEAPIRVKIVDAGDVVKLSVHNEGEPIPKEEQVAIFDQFHRAQANGNHEIGWGIGLTLVQSAVRAHGGKVEVQSPINGGTEFRVILPKDARTRHLQP